MAVNKKQLQRLCRLFDQQPISTAVDEQTLAELGAAYGIDAEQLRGYLERQQQESRRLEVNATEPDSRTQRPFEGVDAPALRSIAACAHPALATAAKLELARQDFFSFCNLRAPDFYKPDRAFLVKLCTELQSFYESNDQIMIINLPPRHGKSRTAGLFEQWIFGRNPRERIMTGSYNETLSTTFSRTVRDGINEVKASPDKIVYSDVFPGVHIKRGDGAMNLWALGGQYASYLATSPDGTATGFGASLMVIDDLIKSASEAFNDTILENHWSWFTNTMLSRLEEGGKIIIIMTRWANGDLVVHRSQTIGILRRLLASPCVVVLALRQQGRVLRLGEHKHPCNSPHCLTAVDY